MTATGMSRTTADRGPAVDPRRRPREGGRGLFVRLSIALLALAAAAAAETPSRVDAFGTIRTLGQNTEHERITRAALACPAGVPSDGTCFEPLSIDSLAGKGGIVGTFGAVGAPDIPPPEKAAAHCDEGDFLDAGIFPKVKRYPRTRKAANADLIACRTFLRSRFNQGLRAAPGMLDAKGRIIASQVDLSGSTCTFLGQLSGRGKCDVYDGFGRALHGVQDFYSHSNWSDARVAGPKVTDRNPPGLAQRAVAPLMDFRRVGNPPIPARLLTGCFSKHEVYLSPIDFCKAGLRRTSRVRHEDVNKDKGDIDPVTGAATNPRTKRGRVGANFARAVGLAIRDSRRQWADYRAELILRYGAQRGNLMICALTRDDPVTACQGRKVAIVIDSSGSNATTDPGNRRIAAAQTFNAGLASAAQVGTTGVPDRSAVIDFDGAARVVSPLGDPDVASFAGIDSSGGTNIAAGVSAGLAELTRDPQDPTGDRSGILVLTDGQDSDRTALIAAVRAATTAGVRVSFGFLAPPATAASTARAHAQVAPPPDLVQAILESGGVFSTIDSAEAQDAFVALVGSRGVTALDDPNGARDGGSITAGVGVTGLAGPGPDRDTYPFRATPGRLLTITARTLAGGPVGLEAHDVAAGRRLARVRTGGDGQATLRGRFRSARLLDLEVTSKGTGGSYSLAIEESGVDLLGTARRDRLRCGGQPTYVRAGGGNDTIRCGAGDDMIRGGLGRDVQRGGAGDDVFLVGRGDRHVGLERIDGGPGTDVVEFASRLRGTPRCVPGRRIIFRSGRARFEIRNVERITFAGRAC